MEGVSEVRVAAARVAEGREWEAPDWAAEVNWAVVEMAVVAKAMAEAAMAAVEMEGSVAETYYLALVEVVTAGAVGKVVAGTEAVGTAVAVGTVEEDWVWEAPERVAVAMVVAGEAKEAMDLAKVVAEMSRRLRR